VALVAAGAFFYDDAACVRASHYAARPRVRGYYYAGLATLSRHGLMRVGTFIPWRTDMLLFIALIIPVTWAGIELSCYALSILVDIEDIE